MNRLRIYSGGTGELLLDTAESTGSERSALIEDTYRSGVLLYYDPQGEVRCYVQIYRQAPEQYVVVYETDPSKTDDLLHDCKRTVEENVRERNWSIETGAGANQTVFDSIGSSRLRLHETHRRIDAQLEESLDDSPLSLSDVWDWLESNHGHKIELVTPDAVSSIETLEYIRSDLDGNAVVAISRSGWTTAVQSADVIIRPDSSANTVKVSTGTRDRIRKQRLEQLKADTKEAIDNLHGTLLDATATATALQKAGLDHRFDVRFHPDELPSPWRMTFRSTVVPVGILAVVLAVGYSLLVLALPAVAELLSRPIIVMIPGLERLPYLSTLTFQLASWQLVLGSSVLLSIVVLTTPGFRRLLAGGWIKTSSLSRGGKGYILPIDESRNAPPRENVDENEDVNTNTIRKLLSELRRYEESEESFRYTLETIFGRIGIHVRSRAELNRSRRLGAIGGVGSGLLCGVVAYIITSAVILSVLSLLSTWWVRLLQALTYIVGIATVSRILVLARS